MRRGWVLGSSAVMMVIALAAWLLPASLLGRSFAQGETEPVTITWPFEGSAVPGPNVLVQWEGPSPAAATPEAGLAVYLVVDSATAVVEGEPLPDSPGVIRAGENPAIVPDLSPGPHTVQLVVTSDGAVPAEGFDRPVVSFTVLAPHPANLYQGTCDNLESSPEFPLADVGSGLPGATLPASEGETSAEGPLPIGAATAFPVEVSDSMVDVPLEELLSAPHAIAVLASADDSTMIACGDIGGPVFRGTLRIGLAEVQASGYVGVATLTATGDQTRVLIELTQNLFERTVVPPGTPAGIETAVATAPPATPTETAPAEPTATETATPTESPTETATIEPTATQTSEPAATEIPTGTAEPTATEA